MIYEGMQSGEGNLSDFEPLSVEVTLGRKPSIQKYKRMDTHPCFSAIIIGEPPI